MAAGQHEGGAAAPAAAGGAGAQGEGDNSCAAPKEWMRKLRPEIGGGSCSQRLVRRCRQKLVFSVHTSFWLQLRTNFWLPLPPLTFFFFFFFFLLFIFLFFSFSFKKDTASLWQQTGTLWWRVTGRCEGHAPVYGLRLGKGAARYHGRTEIFQQLRASP